LTDAGRKRNKTIYFISGFPRSGNTLLASILNQNSNIDATAHSILPDILFSIENIKHYNVAYNNFPDRQSVDNVSKNIFDSYYKDWSADIIIERGDWITPCNFSLLEKYFLGEIKIVVLVRGILDIIKSYLNLCAVDSEFHINKTYDSLDKTTLYKDEIEEKCDIIMRKGGYVDVILYSIKWLFDNNKEKHLYFVDYDELVKNTKNTIKGIYNFLNIDFFDHHFTHLEQLNVNNTSYNDNILGIGGDMHTIRTNAIKEIDYQIELPVRVINNYSNLELWRKIPD
tara:strand:+ start:40 stop:891 length:852 start_codon:yes stop_codon:yes gene_type:complete